MGIKRIGKHLLLNRGRVRQAFPRHALANIEAAIKASEKQHTGQIRFVVEGALDGRPLFNDQAARARALDVFSLERIWDTMHNNGVLIYLLLADHDVEIVADRGIDAKVGEGAWLTICTAMEAQFRQGHFETGVIEGIASVTKYMITYFPASGPHKNELPDAPTVL